MSKLFFARLRLVWSSISNARATCFPAYSGSSCCASVACVRAFPRLETSPVFPSRRSAVAQRRCACRQLCDARPPCACMTFRCHDNARRQHASN